MSEHWLWLLPLAGFAAGFVDSVAGGGGLVTVPVLLAAGLPVDLALGTNKGQAVFGAATSTYGFWRARLLHPRVLRYGFPAGLIGSLLGAWLLTQLDRTALEPLVLLLLVGAAVLVLIPRPKAKALVEGDETKRPMPSRLLVPMALAIGAYDGFFGPGTGTLLIVGFLWLFQASALSASANAKVVNFASNLAACALFTAKSMVLWRIAVPMGLANLLGAFVGTRVTLRAGSEFVRAVAVCVALALAAKVALSAPEPHDRGALGRERRR